LQYSEDLKLGPNVEIGPKDNLETAPSKQNVINVKKLCL
jgi:hypothetical protein